jgi:uncharacterized protein (DUF433 family)
LENDYLRLWDTATAEITLGNVRRAAERRSASPSRSSLRARPRLAKERRRGRGRVKSEVRGQSSPSAGAGLRRRAQEKIDCATIKLIQYLVIVSSVVSQDPEILGGEPVFTGTRVPVKSLFDHFEAGYSIEQFLEGFPSVKREQIIALLEEVVLARTART